jgi:hydroxyethylthiazole kinase
VSVALTKNHSAHLLEELRRREPLVQCLTNTVVAGFTANALLALGASAAMVDGDEEAGLFAGVASGVLINLGTPHREQRDAMWQAATQANEQGTPWVLDPVAIGVLPLRTRLASELVALRPTVIRGNPSEILALAGLGSGGRGVDSLAGPEAAVDAAHLLASTYGSVVAVSGAVDIVTDGTRTVRLSNGHPLLTRVTGGGCALGAVMAAFAGLDDDRFLSVCAAVSTYTIAAEIAAARAQGPGSFAVEFLDALAGIDGETVLSRVAAA